MIDNVPTVKRLRAIIAFSNARLSRLESEAAKLEGDGGGERTLDAIMYHKEVLEPTRKLLAVAESAAREAAASERSELLVSLSAAVIRCRKDGSVDPVACLEAVARLLETLAADMADPPALEEKIG